MGRKSGRSPWKRTLRKLLSIEVLVLIGLTMSTMWLIHKVSHGGLGAGHSAAPASGHEPHRGGGSRGGGGEGRAAPTAGNSPRPEPSQSAAAAKKRHPKPEVTIEDGEDEGEEEFEDDEGEEGEKKPKRPPPRKSKAGPTRKWREGDELPSVDGIPIRMNNFVKKDIFIHQGNYVKLLKHYMNPERDPRFEIKNAKSFPDAGMKFMEQYNFNSCAVVGNSGSLLNSTFGASIDSHDSILRVNQAPPGDKENRLQKRVGSRTTFRLINTRWANKYGDVRFVEAPAMGRTSLPLEKDVTLVVTRARPRAYDQMAQYLKGARTDVKALYLSSRVVSAARRLLIEYRMRLEAAGWGPFEGGDTPSSGFVATFMLLQACNNVTVYGFGLDAEDGTAQQYHYFHIFSPSHSKKKNSMNKTHSFDAERMLLRALQQFGHIRVCSYMPRNREHNSRCGIRSRKWLRESRKEAKRAEASDFGELDGIKEKSRWKKKPPSVVEAEEEARRRDREEEDAAAAAEEEEAEEAEEEAEEGGAEEGAEEEGAEEVVGTKGGKGAMGAKGKPAGGEGTKEGAEEGGEGEEEEEEEEGEEGAGGDAPGADEDWMDSKSSKPKAAVTLSEEERAAIRKANDDAMKAIQAGLLGGEEDE